MNEKTTNYNDETRMEPGNPVNEDEMKAEAPQMENRPRNNVAKGIATGGIGVLAGVVGAVGIMAFREAPQMEAPQVTGGDGFTPPVVPEPETLEEIVIATSPEDSMCFHEAFATAREEVGPNGIFEWRGGIYGTYYTEEWDNFSDEYKEVFRGHDWLAEISADDDEPASDLAENPEAPETPDTPENPENIDIAENLENPETPDTPEYPEDPAPAEAGFGQHTINVDENGNQFITLLDAITGQEVQISPEDLQYAVLDSRGELIGVIGQDVLASVEDPGSCYLVLEDDEVLVYEEDGTELIDDDDSVDILNGPDTDVAQIDTVDDDPAVIDEGDTVGDYLAENELPDYANDAPVDDFIA